MASKIEPARLKLKAAGVVSPPEPARAAQETADVYLWRVLTNGDGILPAGYRGYLGHLVDENVCLPPTR